MEMVNSMTTTKVQYGLTVDGELLGYMSVANGPDAEFCVERAYSLHSDEGQPWLVADLKTAQEVAATSTEWYNAGHDSPENQYVGRCKVARVTVTMVVEEL
jgi:hypothetical protein